MKRKDLQIFDFNEQAVRVVMRGDEPWWVAKDVCEALEIQNTTQAVENLDEDERAMFCIGRQGEANIISESGVFALIMRSNKPEAKKFRKWVTSEVLPAIRKTGRFSLSTIPMPPVIEMLREMFYEAKRDGTPGKEVGEIQNVLLKEIVEWSEVERIRNTMIQVGETGEEVAVIYKLIPSNSKSNKGYNRVF